MTLLEYGEFTQFAVDLANGDAGMPFELMSADEQQRAWLEVNDGA